MKIQTMDKLLKKKKNKRKKNGKMPAGLETMMKVAMAMAMTIMVQIHIVTKSQIITKAIAMTEKITMRAVPRMDIIHVMMEQTKLIGETVKMLLRTTTTTTTVDLIQMIYQGVRTV